MGNLGLLIVVTLLIVYLAMALMSPLNGTWTRSDGPSISIAPGMWMGGKVKGLRIGGAQDAWYSGRHTVCVYDPKHGDSRIVISHNPDVAYLIRKGVAGCVELQRARST